jgi:hypothetical protein
MQGRNRLPRTVALVAATFAMIVFTAGVVLARPVADDGSRSGSDASAGPLRLTAPFPLGFDLSSLGVPLSDLTSVGLAGATAAFAGDGPNMFIVDDDGAQCPNAAYTTIQAAVTAAGTDDQIKVCPGLYSEQVRISGPAKDGLTLFSQVPLQAVIQAPAVMTQPNSIVLAENVQDVTLRQFTISGPFVAPAGCALPLGRHTGVRISNASATLFGNHITQIRNVIPALWGCQDGIAVQVGRMFESQTGTATLRNNLIDFYQKGGVVVDGPGSSAHVTQNEVVGDTSPAITTLIAQNGIQISRQAGAEVDHNIVRDNFFCCNTANDTASGILLFQTPDDVTVHHNDVRKNGDGIAFTEVDQALIDHNNVIGNMNNGIAAYPMTADNTISFNKATNNVEFDCFDSSVGTGTAGTANFWIKDMGLTENRPGLCRRPPSS